MGKCYDSCYLPYSAGTCSDFSINVYKDGCDFVDELYETILCRNRTHEETWYLEECRRKRMTKPRMEEKLRNSPEFESCATCETNCQVPTPKPTSSPTATPTQARPIAKLPYGTASCIAGADITSQTECEQAIATLGITDLNNTMWVGTHGGIPKWCSVREPGYDRRGHFGGNNSGGVGRNDLAPICYADVSEWTLNYPC